VGFDDVARLVTQNDKAFAAAGLEAEALGLREGGFKRSFLPSFGAVAGLESFETGPYGRKTQPYGDLEARVNVLRGGREAKAEAGRRAAAARGRAEAADALAVRVARARGDYLRLVHAREAAGLVREARVENERLLERADRRIRRGLATEADRLEFEVAASQLREDEEGFGHLAVQLSIRLRPALGLADGAELETPASLEHLHDDALLARPLDASAHRETAALAARRDAARAQAEGAGLWWAPSLDAYAGKHLYTLRDRDYSAASLRDDAVVGGRLSLRLFDGGSEAAEARARRLEAAAADRLLEQRLRELSARVRFVKEELKHAHELVHFAEERIAMSRRYLEATLDEYDRGVKNSLDVLSAAQRAAGYRRELAARKLDYLLTRTVLMAEHGL
jgi:outer membrane protein TolC